LRRRSTRTKLERRASQQFESGSWTRHHRRCFAMAAHGLYVWDIAEDWSKIKFDRMKRVLMAKFTQHEDLKALLLSSGTARLVESATVDNPVNRLWGEVNGVGQNKLGVLLMEVRAEILAAEPKARRKADAKEPRYCAGTRSRSKSRRRQQPTPSVPETVGVTIASLRRQTDPNEALRRGRRNAVAYCAAHSRAHR